MSTGSHAASRTAFIFPGQGSQAVGMGKALADSFPAAKAVFEEVDAALGEKLSQIIWEGPAETLTLTANAQPALLAVSLAALRVLESEAGVELARDAAFVAGHSLGEYSALAASGALTITEAARLLRIRGRAMQDAVPPGEGAMAALLGLDYDQAIAVAAEAAQGDVCEPANDNAPGQVVVSGSKAAVERAMVLAKQKGAMKAVLAPMAKVRTNSSTGVIRSSAVNRATIDTTQASTRLIAIRKRRLSARSAIAPAGRANRKIGKVVAACTSETMAGDGARLVISQPAPTSCIQVPIFDTSVATQSSAKARCPKGAQGDPPPAFPSAIPVVIP